jgi:hypothetical protein
MDASLAEQMIQVWALLSGVAIAGLLAIAAMRASHRARQPIPVRRR